LDHPTLPFGLEIGKIVKYAAGFDPREKPRGPDPHRAQPSAPKTVDITQISRRKGPMRIIGGCRENGLAYQSLVNEISAEEIRTAAK
jgi:hypothetical protein